MGSYGDSPYRSGQSGDYFGSSNVSSNIPSSYYPSGGREQHGQQQQQQLWGGDGRIHRSIDSGISPSGYDDSFSPTAVKPDGSVLHRGSDSAWEDVESMRTWAQHGQSLKTDPNESLADDSYYLPGDVEPDFTSLDSVGEGSKKSKKSSSRSSQPKQGSSSKPLSLIAPAGNVTDTGSHHSTPSTSSHKPSSQSAQAGQPQRLRSQLRTANRTKPTAPAGGSDSDGGKGSGSGSRHPHHKPAESSEERVARALHNQVEQQYRKRLNEQFEQLLSVLPQDEGPKKKLAVAGSKDDLVADTKSSKDSADRRVSKAEVLDRARRRIRRLEREREGLEQQNRELSGRVDELRDEWERRMATGGDPREYGIITP